MTARKIRGHEGLVELCNLSSPVKTFLGPIKSYKFIYDQDTHESALTCSSFRLLESLDLTSPVGQLLNETIQAHQNVYKTGTTTLFFLVGAWSNAVLECLHQGVPTSLIISVMLEGLNSCIENLDSLHIHLNNIVITNQSSSRSTNVRHENTSDSDKHCFPCFVREDWPKHFSKSSKHIQLTEANTEGLNRTYQMSRLSRSKYFSILNRSCFQNTSTTPNNNHALGDLTKSLSHGSSEAMKLVEKAVTYLFENAEDTSVTKDLFHASQLEICFLQGQSNSHSNASFGYTTLITSENAAIAKELEGKPLKVLLVDGELTEKYRHLGFNNATNVKSISEFTNSGISIPEDPWLSSAFRKIIDANVDLILVRGLVCPQLMMNCIQKNILIIPNVKQKVLQAISECTGAEPVNYHTQINQHSVGYGVYANICTQYSSFLEYSQVIALTLQAGTMNLVTVVLNCSLMPKMQILEDQFWACSYRLHHALHDEKVFPGGGAVELLCLDHLRKLENSAVPFNSDSRGHYMSSWVSTTATHYKASVFRCLAKGWYKYVSVLLCNMNTYSSELESMTFINNELQIMSDFPSPSSYILNEYSRKLALVDNLGVPTESRPAIVYDNVVPKVEAWRSAMHLVLTVLQSDAEIITGSIIHIKQRESVHGEKMFL
ncbi:Bardet-Biedl syndrome 12 protein isoform X2 [Pseudophryne corroboree]